MYPGRAAGASRLVTGKPCAGVFAGGGGFTAAGKLARNAGRYSQPGFHRHYAAYTIQTGDPAVEKNRVQGGGDPGTACWPGSPRIVLLQG